MSIETSIEVSRGTESVPDDKFDRHMKKARQADIDSKKEIFIHQTEQKVSYNDKVCGIKSSVY